jgi:two-component system chemotaxis response regulator CheY
MVQSAHRDCRALGAEANDGPMKSALSKLLQPQIAALRVLVVDDDHHMRKVVRTMLAAIGVTTVFEAGDGATGLEAIRKNNPDLVIVDWEMPNIDGAQ